MKKHLSVLGLFVRSSLLRILGVIVLSSLVQTGLFAYTMHSTFSSGDPVWGLESIVSDSRIAFVFAAAFLLLTIQLVSACSAYSTKTQYTLSRLSVTQKAVFFWQTAANCLFYLLFWTIEVIVVFLCALYFAHIADPSAISNQTVFLAFYRQPFLHGLLPLDQTSIYIRNIMLVLGLGMSAAVFSFRQRRKGLGLELYILAPLVCIMFPRQTSEMFGDIFLIMLSAFLMFTTLYSVFTKEDSYGEA